MMYWNKYDDPVFTCLDYVEAYIETDYKEIGLYYVETDQYFPLRGT